MSTQPARTLTAVTCRNCGGAVATRPGERLPACLFCGSAALDEPEERAEVEVPEVVLPFEVDEAGADAAFRAFARSSFWYPSDIRHARVELERILLPAWTWDGTVDAHFSGLVKAGTRSGKRPFAGSEVVRLDGVLVPSSSAITRGELAAISPFDAAQAVPFEADAAEAPYELGRLTRQAALHEAEAGMAEAVRRRVQAEQGALELKVACLFPELRGHPLLLPVYVGTWRRKDRLYRFVINGQTGTLTGTAPTSWIKVVVVILAVCTVLFGLVTMLGLCAGGAGLVTHL